MARSSCSLRWVAQTWLLAAIFACAMEAQADSREECEQQYKPHSGQEGKDVVWVPTDDKLVVRMLQMADLKPGEQVYDLGAGDGKIAISAAKRFGARAVGVEYNGDLAKLAQCFAEAEGVAARVSIVQGDIFETDFSTADVVTLYLLPELNLRLRPTLLKMAPGTRIVSHSFLMDDWEPDERSTTEEGSAYLWIVPADTAGKWRFTPDKADKEGQPFDVELSQTFQQIKGTYGRKKQALGSATLNGPTIALSFVEGDQPTQVAGRVEGNKIVATVTRAGKKATYTGTRIDS